MFGLFGKKVPCFQCDKKVKEKETLYRRGFRFCSAGCVTSFLADSPLKPRGGAESLWRVQAKAELGLALGELVAIHRVAGGNSSLFGSSQVMGIGAAVALNNKDEVQEAFARYNAHLIQARPYLYGFGMKDHCDALETQDLDELFELSALGAGPMQMRKVRDLVEPVVPVVQRAYEAL